MKLLLNLLMLFLFFGCKSYSISFKDNGTTPEEWKSFSIKNLETTAPNCPLDYAPKLTENLKDALQNNTRLSLNTKTGSGEVYIEGNVTTYQVTPIAIQNNNNASQNRLTIGVQFIIYISAPKEEIMNLNASRFADFNSSTNLSTIEGELLEQINSQIAQDLINKLLGNW